MLMRGEAKRQQVRKNSHPGDLSKLLEEARDLVGQCSSAAVPSMAVNASGLYDEGLAIPRLQRGLEQLREVSADLAAKSASLVPRGYE
jgi:hypothetical protein